MEIEWLLGKQCTRVLKSNGSFIFEFGEARLVCESLWRILSEGRIRLTSLDHGRQYGRPSPVDATEEATQELVGRSVVGASVVEWSADMTIVFDRDRTLQLLTDSTGYEAWDLQAPGRHLVASSGGSIVDFSS